jgi:hypothetical protein
MLDRRALDGEATDGQRTDRSGPDSHCTDGDRRHRLWGADPRADDSGSDVADKEGML